jgi:hypothetical protein
MQMNRHYIPGNPFAVVSTAAGRLAVDEFNEDCY